MKKNSYGRNKKVTPKLYTPVLTNGVNNALTSFPALSLISVMIFFFTFAVYANSFRNEFTNWDDNSLIVQNKIIRSLSIDNVKKIFTLHKGATYQPLRVLSYAIDYHFWKFNTLGYHIHNTLLHALASVLLFLSLLKALPMLWNDGKGDKKYEQFFLAVSLTTSVLFVVHPINVESVVWLSSRKYCLLSFFTFLSFYLFVSGADKTGKTGAFFFCGSMITCIMAMMSSPFGVVIPLFFFLFDYCRYSSLSIIAVFKKRIIWYLPWFVIFITAGAILFIALMGHGHGNGGANTEFYKNSPTITFYTMLRVLFDYMRNFVVPLYLNNRYPDYVVSNFFMPKTIIAFLGLGLICSYLFLKYIGSAESISSVKFINSAESATSVHSAKSLTFVKKNRISFFCIGWFFLFWLPTANIVPISTKMADRYVYIAGAGLFLGFSIILWKLFFFSKNFSKNKYIKISIIVFLSALLLCFTILTLQRNLVWKNSATLWQDSIKKDPQNYIAYNNLGVHFYYIEGKFKKALTEYRKALELSPNNPDILQNICPALVRTKHYDEADRYYKKLLALHPCDYKASNDYGNLLKIRGKIYEAISRYKNAIKCNNTYIKAYYNIALSYGLLNKRKKEEKYYIKVLQMDDKHAQALNNLASLMISEARFHEALNLLKRAVKIPQKDKSDVYFNLGLAYMYLKQYLQSEKNFKTVIIKNPKDSKAHLLLSIVLLKQNKKQEAWTHLKETLKLDPGNQNALKIKSQFDITAMNPI